MNLRKVAIIGLVMAVMGMALVIGVSFSSPRAEAASCTSGCTTTSVTKSVNYTKIVVNGTNVTLQQYLLLAAASGGTISGSGCIDMTLTYKAIRNYFNVYHDTMYAQELAVNWCWGGCPPARGCQQVAGANPYDHINGTPKFMSWVDQTCCFVHQDGAASYLSTWYHLSGRNPDSGFKVWAVVSEQQCIIPGVPCNENTTTIWIEMHGNGTYDWDAHGASVGGFGV